MSEQHESIAPQDWRQQIRERGKEAFQLDEMRRLGFWPPEKGLEISMEEAEREVKRLDRELAPLRKEAKDLEAQIAKGQDIERAIAEIRAKRIERSKAQRAARKEQKAREKAERAALWKEKRANAPQFLGPGVSQGLQFSEQPSEKLRWSGLPVLNSHAEIAAAMALEPRVLTWLCFHRGASLVDHYTRFQIPKKRGGMRNVSSPKPTLRIAQSYVQNEILSKVPIHGAASAFFPGASVVQNAAKHAEKAVVIRIDLKDFFPSIGFKRVKNCFQNLGYSEGVSTVFALVCTEAPRVELSLDGQRYHVAVSDRVLPQGACTSPALTNILCRRLDARLENLAKSLGFAYSRYADDLVFSSENCDADVKKMIGLTRKIVAEERFEVNDEKTNVMRPNQKQVVTGLVVNAGKTPRVSRDELRRFRAFLHQTGEIGEAAMSEKLGKSARGYATGMLAWIAMSDAEKAAKLRASAAWLDEF